METLVCALISFAVGYFLGRVELEERVSRLATLKLKELVKLLESLDEEEKQ